MNRAFERAIACTIADTLHGILDGAPWHGGRPYGTTHFTRRLQRVDTEVVRRQTTYSAAYPELEMALNAQVLIKAIAEGISFTITAAGPGFALHTTFTPTVQVARAALRMLDQCPAKN